MTILTYNNRAFKPAHQGKQDAAHRGYAIARQVGTGIMVFLLGTSVVTAVIALRTVIYISRLNLW